MFVNTLDLDEDLNTIYDQFMQKTMKFSEFICLSVYTTVANVSSW